MHRLLVVRLASDPSADASPGLHALELLLEALDRHPTAHLNLALTPDAVAALAAHGGLRGGVERRAMLGRVELVATTRTAGDVDVGRAVEAFKAHFPPTLRPQALWPAGLHPPPAVVTAVYHRELVYLLVGEDDVLPKDPSGRSLASLATRPGLFLLPVDDGASRRLLSGPDEARAMLDETPAGTARAQVLGADLSRPPAHLGGLVRLIESGRTLCLQDLSYVVRERRLARLAGDAT